MKLSEDTKEGLFFFVGALFWALVFYVMFIAPLNQFGWFHKY